MNAKTLPLAAFLMTAALAAQAQLLNPSSGGTGFGLGPTAGLSGLGGSGGSDPLNDDMTYKCSTVPYRPCTADELNRQENVKRARQCPMSPATDACASFLMRALTGPDAKDKTAPAEVIAAYTPPPGQRWASPDCQRIPCRLEPDPNQATEVDEIVVTAPRRQQAPRDGEPGFIGPPCPPEICGGANSNSNWNSQFEAIKEKNPDAINVGNEKYIIPDPTDPTKVTECGPMMCRQVDSAKYKDKLDSARADANMFTGNSVPNKPPKENVPPVPAQQNPVNPNPTTGGSASDDGNDVASVQRAIGRSGDSLGGTGGATTSGGGYGTAAAGGGEGGASTTIKENVDGKIALQKGFTFNQMIQNSEELDHTARALNGGGNGELAPLDGSGVPTAQKARLADVPLGPDGKPALTQAAANK